MSGHVRSLLAKTIFCNDNEAPSPAPPPPRFARCASSSGPPPPLSRGRMVRALAFSRRVLAPQLFGVRAGMERAPAKYGHVKRETGPVQGGQGWLPAFRSSVTSVSPDQAFKKQIKEGSGTPANAGSPTAASCDAARALLERARLPAFHRGSHLRELFHPKGSASGQASWDVV